jgi:hypothetical protein
MKMGRMKVCKICGAEYLPCANPLVRVGEKNRWQDVACCVEHGAEYFARIAKSRDKFTAAVKKTKAPVVQNDVIAEDTKYAEVDETTDVVEVAESKPLKKKK